MRYSTLLLLAVLSIYAFTAPILSVVEAMKGEILFTDADITGYDPAKIIFELSPEKSAELIKMPTFGGRNPFAIKDETGVICRGYFYSTVSSINFTGPVIMIDQTSGNVAAPYFALRSAYPDFSQAFTDKTQTDRIAEAMRKAGKIIDIDNKSLPLKQKWTGSVKFAEADGVSVSILTFPDSFAVNKPTIMHTLVSCDKPETAGEISVNAKLESDIGDVVSESIVSNIKLPVNKKFFVISKINLLPPPPKPPVFTPATPLDENQNIPYPKQALEEEIKGSLKVKVDIRETGVVNGITVTETSGNDMLDTATLRAFTYWKFNPAKTGETTEKCQQIYQVDYNGTAATAKNITPPPPPVPAPVIPANTLYAIPGEASLTIYVNYTDAAGKTITQRVPAIPIIVE